MAPKGTTMPFGTLKSLPAMASSFPEEAALAPPVCGAAARATAVSTSSAARLSAPTLGDAALRFACALPPPVVREASLTASARTPPLASTVRRKAFPSGAASRKLANSGASEVQAKTTPSCRARKARWLSTGKSRATITPRQRGGNSSSPPASLQKMTAPWAGKSRDQASLRDPQRTQIPHLEPAAIAVQSGRPAATLALCITSWTSFDTWKSTEARNSASTKTETAWPSIPILRPRAGTPA
mmetsp:Transcript_106467/g.237659  ORF Transcript_106467/g.237659 Transcript_106467/m.237659 type:complete len:242 (+) Transcript_106467:104-829(+)